MRGEIKSAYNALARRGGVIEGNSARLLRTLGFNGSWHDFSNHFPVEKTDPGRYRITLPNLEVTTIKPRPIWASPELFAGCAANYVLGTGEANDFLPYEGDYSEIGLMMGALAVHIDDLIGGIHVPPETTKQILYQAERAIYTTTGSGRFEIFGNVTGIR